MAHLIDKDALVAEITHKIKVLEAFIKNFNGISDIVEKAKNKIEALGDALLFIDTLEVKEVDLEKAIDDYIYTHNGRKRLALELDWKCCNLTLKGGDEIIKFAKHFFELGLRSNITEEDCKLIWNIGDEIPNRPEEEFFKELLRRYKAQKG